LSTQLNDPRLKISSANERCMLKSLGLMITELNMGNILVARKTIDFIARQRLLSFMSMGVVSNLDSMLNPGVSQLRSR
jgi:hypothetical protein